MPRLARTTRPLCSRARRWLPPIALVALAGCSDEATPSLTVGVGADFEVVAVESERLVIRSADGRVLIDGLAPGDVGADAPPHVGFAVRDVTTRYEMQFGSFKPTDEAAGPWRPARRFALSTSADGPVLALHGDNDELLATLTVQSDGDGHLTLATAAGEPSARRLSMGFACEANDHFAGFGAQAIDVDHRGQTVPTFVAENGVGRSLNDEYIGPWFVQGRRHSSHLPIPQYLARRGYVLTTETPYASTFALCSERDDVARIEVELGATVHVFDGPSPAEALARASATFGRPRMPPRWAFAPWLDAVFGADEVRRVAARLRDEQVPVGAIWTEDWRGGDWTGDNYALAEEWEVDGELYPDFADMVGELHDAGMAMLVYFNPFIYEESKAWAEVQPNGWLVQREGGGDYVFPGAKFTETGLLDLFHPDARAWAVGKMRAAIALGADGWMNDFAEWLPTDGETFAGSGQDLHNAYPVAWQEVAREAIDGVGDGVERLFFGRSGWFGTPPLADVIWAGDQRTSFDVDDGLPNIVPIGIGLGLVGVSTYGHDIAGYQSATNPGATKEVFFRWTELGAWSPVMRTHHGNQPLLNWTWEKDAETIAHFRRYATLHMSLVPWLEGLAAVAHDTGLPIWRGMFLTFPEDEAVWPITDQVMVGADVLVAPVQTAGADERQVYLPLGRWYPWDGGDALDGGRSVTAPAPLGEIPVFARAGALVPTYPEGVMTLVYASAEVPGPEAVGDDRVVFAFLGDDGAFEEAGGLGYRLEHQQLPGAGPLELSVEGETLADCAAPPEAPCREGDVAWLAGPGALVVAQGGATMARVAIEGGASDRVVRVVVRR